MIDTHCHLLPGLDDGPSTGHEALALARSMVADGITQALCTPHYSRMFPTDHAEAIDRIHDLEKGLRDAEIGLRVSLAAEVHPGFALSAPLAELSARSIGGRYLLVEVQPDVRPALFPVVEERLGEIGLYAIFGHPERCRAVQKRIEILDESRQNGALVQVVAPSLLGRWGPEVEEAAWRLVNTGRADLLASDAHGVDRRRVHMAECRGVIADRLGSPVASELTERRPALALATADQSEPEADDRRPYGY